MSDGRGLIIFAKLPRPGDVKTRLGRSIGMKQAAAIYAELAEYAFAVGDAAMREGIRVFLFYDPMGEEQDIRQWVGREFSYHVQAGEALGDRMRNAFDFTFAQGITKSVIIGTDIPALEYGDVYQAFTVLDSVDIVLGPTADGGYYLLGMSAPTKDLFSGIAWGTPEVYRKTVEHTEHMGLSSIALRELDDVDTLQSYQKYVQAKARTI